MNRWPAWTHPAGDLLRPDVPVQALGGGYESCLPDAAQLAGLRPLVHVHAAQVCPARPGPLAVPDEALPPVDRMAAGDLDDGGQVDRVEGRAADERGEDFQPVPALTTGVGVELEQGIRGHLASPQTFRRAASNAGSWTSTCP